MNGNKLEHMLVRYSAKRPARAEDGAMGGRYVFINRDIAVLGVWLSDQFCEDVRRAIEEEDPRLELVGVQYVERLHPSPLCKLMSSHGEVVFDARTGVVLKVDEETDEPGCLARIYRIDVENLRLLLPDLDTRQEVDILDAGYWYVTDRGSTGFEPPEADHAAWTAGKRDTPF